MFVVVHGTTGMVMDPYALGYIIDPGGSKYPSSHNKFVGYTEEQPARVFAEWCVRKWPQNEYAIYKRIASAKASIPPVEWKTHPE